MKILVVQDHLRSGGTERQTVFLSGAFAQSGHATTLLTFRPGGALAAMVSASVQRSALQTFDTTLDWFAPRLAAVARTEAPDVILCMGRMANCYGAALHAAAPGAAVIGTMRTGKALPWLFRRSLQRVRHVVSNSAEARDTLVRRYAMPADKITVIHNSLVFPPAPHDAAAVRAEWRARFGATPDTTVLVCVAMFRPEKNQRELIETVATLPASTQFQLWLAGDGPARASCESLVAARGLAPRVKFVGFQRDPAPLYTAADIAVHASHSDALSNFVIEAQAHGLPAVVYESQGMRECVVPGETGWVFRAGDRVGFVRQLQALIAEPAEARRARGDAARAFARSTFDPQRQVTAYLDLFARLRR